MAGLDTEALYALDFPSFCRDRVRIQTKKALGGNEVSPLELNAVQLDLHRKLEAQMEREGRVRAIILKARQMGVTTMTSARFYWRCVTQRGIRAAQMGHHMAATTAAAQMIQRMVRHDPEHPVLSKNNLSEVRFKGRDSGFSLTTAGQPEVGRGLTVHLMHGLEVAFWKDAYSHMNGIGETVPSTHSEMIIESTANGPGGWFYDEWQAAEAGESEFMPCFYPWWMDPGYIAKAPADFELDSTSPDDGVPSEAEYAEMHGLNNDRMYWRRMKIGRNKNPYKFMQEYPATAQEAFQTSGVGSLIPSKLITKARNCRVPMEMVRSMPLVVGVDPAYHGRDMATIMRRRGMKAYNLQTFPDIREPELVGFIIRLCEEERPDRVFVDRGGIGQPLLHQVHHQRPDLRQVVVGVDFGERAWSQEYRLRRDEMWGEMLKWFKEGGVQIPDDGALHTDLQAPSYTHDQSGALKLESKDDTAKRLRKLLRGSGGTTRGRSLSTDRADALALTFAQPVAAKRSPAGMDMHDPSALPRIGAERKVLLERRRRDQAGFGWDLFDE